MSEGIMHADARSESPSPPPAAVDHVLIAVADLAEGARRLEAEYGLHALPGGRHPGVGTANMIVPLGSDYLELIAIVDRDEAGRAPTSRRIARALADGCTFATWAVRTTDLGALRTRLLKNGWKLPEPSSGSRVRPDGITLRWRTLFLAPVDEPGVLPFVIEWSVPPGMHPGEMAAVHASGSKGIGLVRLGDPDPAAAADRLRALLGPDARVAVERAETSGVLAVELNTPTGKITVR